VNPYRAGSGSILFGIVEENNFFGRYTEAVDNVLKSGALWLHQPDFMRGESRVEHTSNLLVIGLAVPMDSICIAEAGNGIGTTGFAHELRRTWGQS